jgi:phospholipid/cholesterol/gamma-HCH transport system permease protein
MAAWSVLHAGDERLQIVGDVRIHDARSLWRTLLAESPKTGHRLDIDLSQLTSIDGVAMALLVEFRNAISARGAQCAIINAPASVEPMLHIYHGDEPAPFEPPPPKRADPITRIGEGVEALLRHLYEPVLFIGELFEGIGHAIRRPSRVEWRSLPGLLVQSGSDALVIVVVLDFLIGFVIALQTTPPLVAYGANVYVADLIGISVTRELVPLMTAIIMSGRSGAAFAAELGTMHVSEEIDALQTMGISPVPYLVLPRILALVIVAPMLVLVGDAAAVIGGMVVAVRDLNLTPQGYISELRTIVVPWDVLTGLIKATVFGAAIGVIACQEGLAARGAAAGVGRKTTATVVTCLFVIVLFDALLTIVFRGLGI